MKKRESGQTQRRDKLLTNANLDSAIQGCRGKGIVVLGIDDNLHYVMRVTFKYLGASPLLLPIPEFD